MDIGTKLFFHMYLVWGRMMYGILDVLMEVMILGALHAG